MSSRRIVPQLTVSSAAYSQLSPQSVPSATLLSPRGSAAAQRALLASPSPPSSPSLPSLVPRHGKPVLARSLPGRLVKRLLLALCAVAVLAWLVFRQLYLVQQVPDPAHGGDGPQYEMVADTHLPSEPSAVVVEDSNGKSMWTVSIPPSFDFPLRPTQYAEICSQSMELSKSLHESASSLARRMMGYYHWDPNFLDVSEAQAQALLPPPGRPSRPKGLVGDEGIIAHHHMSANAPVCDKSLTYVLETADAGFGATLLRLWMSYGLAVKENRTFFVDDTRWAYGRYTSYFAPPPKADCMPPPPSQMVPCPHSAKHLVVSAATNRFTFGHAFTDEFEDPHKMRVERQHNIFAMLRAGYEALFKLQTDDAKYVADRIQSLYGPVRDEGGISIGMHVRRGDRHPYEFQYHEDYLPLDRYVETARDISRDFAENQTEHASHRPLRALLRRARSAGAKQQAKRHHDALSADEPASARQPPSQTILASDDPDVFAAPEMADARRAQDRIVLASKTALEAAQGGAAAASNKKKPYIDDVSGWEGGFFRDVFWSLGQPEGHVHEAYADDPVPDHAMRLRELVGKSYLLDLAVLGHADAMVCTLSSMGCRILAVMMGWDRAIAQAAWHNVDGDWQWRGLPW